MTKSAEKLANLVNQEDLWINRRGEEIHIPTMDANYRQACRDLLVRECGRITDHILGDLPFRDFLNVSLDSVSWVKQTKLYLALDPGKAKPKTLDVLHDFGDVPTTGTDYSLSVTEWQQILKDAQQMRDLRRLVASSIHWAPRYTSDLRTGNIARLVGKIGLALIKATSTPADYTGSHWDRAKANIEASGIRSGRPNLTKKGLPY